jgi:predicted O-methyltransferase YrrM
MPTPRLAEQAAYYRARANEYDEWWQRLGRHDHGEEFSAQWDEETREVERALARFAPSGNVLELASGTGWWTERLARTAAALTCVDAAPETIALNRERLARGPAASDLHRSRPLRVEPRRAVRRRVLQLLAEPRAK